MLTYIAVGIFVLAFALIAFEVYDKSLIALSGALMMVIVGVLSPEEAIASIEFETILLLMAMMLLVHMASKSGVFAWLNVRIASLTKGNPMAIFLFFSVLTAVMSAFLDNVTTVILIVPLTIELVRGMDKDPKPYIFSEMIFSNIGGALTLIGDPSNIIIGGASKYNFMQFIQNLWMPVLFASVLAIGVFVIVNRKSLRPISDNLVELCVANMIIRKINYKFVKRTIHKDFVIKVIGVLTLTFLGFMMQTYIGLPTFVIALIAAVVLSLMTASRTKLSDALKEVEWPTLLFFAGLFILVAGVEKTGILEALSHWIAGSTANIFYLSLMVLWISGMLSMILDNIPFVTVMVPVIIGIQAQVHGIDTSILWWALSLGACLGGNGSLIGASANVVSAGLARREGVNITFLEHFKFSFPLTLGFLAVSSLYLFIRVG